MAPSQCAGTGWGRVKVVHSSLLRRDGASSDSQLTRFVQIWSVSLRLVAGLRSITKSTRPLPLSVQMSTLCQPHDALSEFSQAISNHPVDSCR